MKRKLRIAQVAPLWYPVPPKGYGGTELVVSQLTEELVRRGHKVTLYASGDSRTGARKRSVVRTALTKMGVPWTSPGHNLLNLEQAVREAGKHDVIHTHIDPFDGFFRAMTKTPSVATLHNHFWPFNPANEPKFHDRVMIYERFKRLPYVAISDAYKRMCPVKLNFVATIHHGVEIGKFRFNPRPDDHFVWLGRIAAVKGLHTAAAAVTELGAKLRISGPFITKESKEYYDARVRPFVDGRNIRFIGQQLAGGKSLFLGAGRALIYPIEWDEPFGIVMIEAMASGTPVIAYRRGSVPEIVKDGVTGYVVDTKKELKEAMRMIDRIDREACREYVVKNFTLEAMADRYERVYRRLADK